MKKIWGIVEREDGWHPHLLVECEGDDDMEYRAWLLACEKSEVDPSLFFRESEENKTFVEQDPPWKTS